MITSEEDFIAAYLAESARLTEGLHVADIGAFVAVLFEAWQRRNTVFICGNGGSASTAQHLVADLFKCTLVSGRPRFKVLSLNDNLPLVSALTNDDGWSEIFTAQLATWWQPGDVVVGISVHGGVGEGDAGPWTQNVLRACHHARDHGGTALAIVGFDGGEMRAACDVSILVPAASTPHTEGLHVVVHHLVTTALRRRIEQTPAGS